MSTTLTLTANKSALISYDAYSSPTNENDHSAASYELSWGSTVRGRRSLIAGFPLPSSGVYDYRAIVRAQVRAWLTSSYTGVGAGSNVTMYSRPVEMNWDETTVTSSDVKFESSVQASFPNTHSAYALFGFFSGDAARDALLYGCEVYTYPRNYYYVTIGSSRHSSPPQLVVEFSDKNVTPKLLTPSPASGVRLDRLQERTFTTWMIQSDFSSIKRLTPASGTFEYRLKGASSITTVAATISSTTISYTAPANTFAAGEYEYRFSVTDNLGQTVYTAWSSFDTRDTVPTATADEPSGNLLDGDQPISFRWTHINESGSAQTKAELQKSADGSTWTALTTVTGSANEYSAPAETFASGTWFWRVRTFNLDNVAGAWSDAASFVTVSAPSTPKVIVQASPRPLITWQTNEQSAYQIQLDTEIDTTDYGSGKSWRSPVYLDDGLHVARVRVQNSYGVWSEWGSATFTVSHTASGAVVLTVDADHRAELSWSYAGSWTEFVVYRDGVAIAKTTDYSYTDDYSVGTVRYQVRACASDGTYNYSLSNEVTVSVMPETVMLSALGSGNWLFLRLSTAQHRTHTIKASRTFSLTHLSGRKFPEAELTEFCDRSISVSYATDDVAEKTALEALMGSPVCLKTPGGKMVIGILDTLSETESMFYSSYTFAVSQMHYPEEVDLDA